MDIYGREWPVEKFPVIEMCFECGQPDNIGDCNHKKLTAEEVKLLGGF
jgi:hypothetical protein